MTVKELYCYEREAGKITHSLEKPECGYTVKFRLIADEGKELTKDGENFTPCIDVESTEGWYEVNAVEKLFSESENSASEADYITALKSLGVRFNG